MAILHDSGESIRGFNGGKMSHVFKQNPQDGRFTYTSKFYSDHAQEAFMYGNFMLKVDGECCCLFKHYDEETKTWYWKFYQRYDAGEKYEGKSETELPGSPLPDGKNPNEYDQGGKKHIYRFVVYQAIGKKQTKFLQDTLKAIDFGVKNGYLPDPNSENCPNAITCEWVGLIHQSNVDGFSFEHGLVPHTEFFCPCIPLSSYEEFVNFVKTHCIEGVIVVHPDGTRYKLRSDCIPEFKSTPWYTKTWKKDKKTRVTTISPKALGPDGLYVWDSDTEQWKKS